MQINEQLRMQSLSPKNKKKNNTNVFILFSSWQNPTEHLLKISSDIFFPPVHIHLRDLYLLS